MRAWRVVEDQEHLASRRLVDSADEAEVLRSLIEDSKPPIPRDALDLHRLLVAPFRYPPLRWGSRFGVTWRRGIWYGSERQPTALAEVCYYRLLFLEHSAATLPALEPRLLALHADVRSPRGVDLRRPPFESDQAALRSPTRYACTQAVGEAMREAGVEVARFASARCPDGGGNVAVFAPSALGPAPRALRSWAARIDEGGGDFWPAGEPDAALHFDRETFLVEGRLPQAA